jgi:hypothetical protein
VIQSIFNGSTMDTGLTKWITTEFGIGLTIASVAMGVYFWCRRGELPGESPVSLQQLAVLDGSEGRHRSVRNAARVTSREARR